MASQWIRRGACALIFASVCAVSFAAPIDCAKAAHPVEKMICSDPLLIRLDTALDNNYGDMITSDIGSGARAELRSTQRQWIRQRNRCTDVDCIRELYVKRVDAVCDYPVISGVHAICIAASEVLDPSTAPAWRSR